MPHKLGGIICRYNYRHLVDGTQSTRKRIFDGTGAKVWYVEECCSICGTVRWHHRNMRMQRINQYKYEWPDDFDKEMTQEQAGEIIFKRMPVTFDVDDEAAQKTQLEIVKDSA